MAKNAALPLQYSRIKNRLPDAEVIRLAEKVKGKALSAAQKQDRVELVDNVLMPEISKFASCIYGKGYEKWYDHNLYRAVQMTAQLLGLGTRDELETLSNEEICDKIQSVLNVSDYERILHLSEEERILEMRSITPNFTNNFSTLDRVSLSSYEKPYDGGGLFGFLFNPLTQITMRIAADPKVIDLVKKGGELVGRAVLSGDTIKYIKEGTPLLKEQLVNKAGEWKKEIVKGAKKGGPWVIVGVALVAAGYGIYKYAEPKIKAKAREKERRMVDVVAELVACLCFNPYAVLNLDADSAYETMRRSYVAKLNEVHPDQVVGQPAEQQASAYQRMKELRIAWEIIQTEKGIHPLF